MPATRDDSQTSYRYLAAMSLRMPSDARERFAFAPGKGSALSRGAALESRLGEYSSGLIALLAALVVALFYPPVSGVKDDATILQQAHDHGVASLFWTYSGYLGVVHRVVALVQGPSPVLIGALGSYLAVGLVALFIMRRVHPVAVLALILVPAANVYGTLSNIQWVLAVYLIAMLAATPPTSGKGRLIDAIGIFACGLTGPFSILLLPLYAIRARNPVWHWHLFVLASAAAIQLTALSMTFRPSAPEHDIFTVVLARAALPLVGIVITGLWLAWRWMAGALYVAGAVVVLGVAGSLHTTAELLDGAGERYFYLPWVLAIGMMALALRDATAERAPSHRGVARADIPLIAYLARRANGPVPLGERIEG